MADKWKPDGSIIEQDGEKILQIRGIRLINKRLVKAVVYYSVVDIEKFIETFITIVSKNRREESLPTRTSSKAPEINIKDLVKETISLLEVRIYQTYTHYYSRLAFYVIICFAFDIPIWQRCDDIIYIPSVVREITPSAVTPSNILLPDDILQKEISTRMTSPRSLSVMRMAAKSLQVKKYKYEHLISMVPQQAFLVLSRLYGEEKDVEYKQYLFNLVMRAYSSLVDIDKNLVGHGDIPDSIDILAAIVSFKIQSFNNLGNLFPSISGFENTDLLEMLVQEGIIAMKDIKFHTLFYVKANSLQDNFVPFIERWERETSSSSKVQLYHDLKSGKITYPYKWRLVVDAIKKGYIKGPSSIKKEVATFPFLNDIWKCSPEEKALIHKYFEPNPISDFFLMGIKPTLQSVLESIRGDDAFVSDYITHGLTFSDEVVDYQSLFAFINETGVEVDLRFLPDDDKIFFLKDLGKDERLVLAKDYYDNYNVFTIKRLGNFFVEDRTSPTNALFIECIANADDHLLQRVIDYAEKYAEILQDIADIVDKSITDLELYKRFVVNMNAIMRVVLGE